MADKGKKGKQGAAPPPPAAAPPPPAAAPPPKDAKPGDQKEEAPPKIKSVQPKDQVGTRKGCRRYKWEFKDSNREFWVMGHAEVKILSLDILNDLFAAVFLVGAAVFAVRTRKTMPVNYVIAVVLIGVAAFFPLIDICLQRKHFRGKKIQRNVLIPPEKEKGKPEPPAKGKEDEKPAKPKEEAKPKEKAEKGEKGKKGKK
ncbi:CKLF like MARVEL transmembrane domain containing 2 [Phyllostomus discolor]|uniref:CKLF like MARVEL transmembrane domain containing 2 n=1 Tax=Phyllostomus discolor TaxID=89673 RepID=A0A833YMH6_9CHIR|nr:CKLF like MARVEL transmembrane domain containing 2 [Phyllostomus discolor]